MDVIAAEVGEVDVPRHQSIGERVPPEGLEELHLVGERRVQAEDLDLTVSEGAEGAVVVV